MEGRIRMRPPISYAILCDGDFPGNADVRDRLMSCDVVVCCDGAASSFMRFRKPEFVVGDMDSLPEDLRQELADQLFPVGEQESNDLSKAFRWICSMLCSAPPASGRTTLWAISRFWRTSPSIWSSAGPAAFSRW